MDHRVDASPATFDFSTSVASVTVRKEGVPRRIVKVVFEREAPSLFLPRSALSRSLRPRPPVGALRVKLKALGRRQARRYRSALWYHVVGSYVIPQVFVTSMIAESCAISNVTREINYVFPLYLYAGVGKADGSLFSRWASAKDGRTPNLDSGFVEQIAAATELRFVSDGRGDLRKTFGPEDILAYIYTVFHSPGYRGRYEALLKLDFPRVPVSGSVDLFRKLADAGHTLLALQLLESPKFGKPITSYTGPGNPEVGRVGWLDGTVWLDAGKPSASEGHRATKHGTIGFEGVPEQVWDFHIGGYQLCHKWLKDRKGRTLSAEDIAHYQKDSRRPERDHPDHGRDRRGH